MKPIRFSNHAIDYINIRGFTESEVIEAIRNGKWVSAKKNRMESKLGFPFQKEWNGKYYNTKEVKPVVTANFPTGLQKSSSMIYSHHG